MKPIDRGAEVLFIEALQTGTVHIAVLPPDDGRDLEPEKCIPMDGSGRALAALLGTPTVTRCGQKTFPYRPNADARHGISYRFRDDQLSAASYRTLAPADQGRAFEHAQPGDEDDLEDAA